MQHCREGAPGEHKRALQARAVSRPPPRATPSIAATVGFGPLSSSSQKLSLMLRAANAWQSGCVPGCKQCWLLGDKRCAALRAHSVSHRFGGAGCSLAGAGNKARAARSRLSDQESSRAHVLSMPPPPDCLTNSLMSKPALNLPFAPVTTIATTSARECASRSRSKSPLSTARTVQVVLQIYAERRNCQAKPASTLITALHTVASEQ